MCLRVTLCILGVVLLSCSAQDISLYGGTGSVSQGDPNKVCIDDGCIVGKLETGNLRPYSAFYGIPFATPPIGRLRFKVLLIRYYPIDPMHLSSSISYLYRAPFHLSDGTALTMPHIHVQRVPRLVRKRNSSLATKTACISTSTVQRRAKLCDNFLSWYSFTEEALKCSLPIHPSSDPNILWTRKI